MAQPKNRRKTRSGDATGRKDEQLREQLSEEQKARAAEMAMATAEVEAERKEVTDLTGKPVPTVLLADEVEDEDDDKILAELEKRAKDDPLVAKLAAKFRQAQRAVDNDVINVVDPGDGTRIITIADDIEAMTYGKKPNGTLNTMSFEAGRKYRVGEDLYKHLEEKGYVYH